MPITLFGQLKCSDGLLYTFRATPAQSLILSWNPALSAMNPNTFTNCNIGSAGLIGGTGGLALLPNISGGTVSPTFFTTQYGSIYYWNGNTWVANGASFGNSPVMAIAGCANGIYAICSTAPGQFQLKRFTAPNTVSVLFTSTLTVASGIACDCNCNFYLLGTSALYKYDASGNLTNTYSFAGMPFLVTQSTHFGILGNTIYVANSSNASSAIAYGSGVINGNSVVTSSMTTGAGQVPVGFASCPFSMPVTSSISSATILCNPSSANIAVTSTPNALSYYWNGPGIVPPITGSVLSVNLPGTYSCVVKDGFCSDTLATLVTTVTTNTTTVQPAITPGSNLCYQANLTLSSSLCPPQFSNSWIGPNIVGASNGQSIGVQGPGIYSLTSTQVNNGCVGTVTATILSQPLLNFGISTPTLCVYSTEGNTKAILTYSGATNYTLLVSPGFSLQVAPSQPVVLYQSAPYANNGAAGSATIIGSNGICTNSAVTNFSVLPITPLKVIPQETTVCSTHSLSLRAYNAVKYQWTIPKENFLSLKDSLAAVQVNGTTVFSVVGTDAYGCNTLPKAITVNVFPSNDGVLMHRSPVCAPACLEFNFKPVLALNNKIDAYWVIDNQTYKGNTFKNCYSVAGQYTLVAVLIDSINNCNNEVEFTIDVNKKPIADFKYLPQIPIEGIDEVVFTATTSKDSLQKFSWYFGETRFTAKGEEITRLYKEAGDYKVAMVVTNEYSCADTLLKVLKVAPDFNIFVPNSFTPNADGRNDIFIPVIRSAKLYDLKIFSRWGKLIFQTSDLQQGWNGSFNDLPCKEDMYNWAIELSTLNGERISKTGHVYLLR